MSAPRHNDPVKRFWDSQADAHGESDVATAPDQSYRQLEINSIIPHIRGTNILDVGCGNGYSTIEFAKHYPRRTFVGLDYSAAMIKNANTAKAAAAITNVSFSVCNVKQIDEYPGRFDSIICTRCLINLAAWPEQSVALAKMSRKILLGDRIILVENFTDGLKNLNTLRTIFSLPEIKPPWHNHYLDTWQFEDFCSSGTLVIKHKANIGNLYYIISRVVYAELAAREGVDPSYNHPINQIAAKLPNLGTYNFSPNMLYVLERR